MNVAGEPLLYWLHNCPRDVARLEAGGDIVDIRKLGLMRMRAKLAGPIQVMNPTTVLSAAAFRMERLDCAQPTVAFEPSEVTGGECCRGPLPRLETDSDGEPGILSIVDRLRARREKLCNSEAVRS